MRHHIFPQLCGYLIFCLDVSILHEIVTGPTSQEGLNAHSNAPVRSPPRVEYIELELYGSPMRQAKGSPFAQHRIIPQNTFTLSLKQKGSFGGLCLHESLI